MSELNNTNETEQAIPVAKEDRVQYMNDLVQEAIHDPGWKSPDFVKGMIAQGIGWTILGI